MHPAATAAPSQPSGIALIGMSGRFPGAADLNAFWENLAAGRETITRFSTEDLQEQGIDPQLLADARYVPARPVLEGVELFDADFFAYAPREAELIDPQQRIFLECAWQALEDAGYDPESFDGQIGVYAGASANSYLLRNLLASRQALDPASSFLALTASDKDYLATRVSYKLNLRGPSLTVQTACSTSLVAVHLACESLYNGECDMALAGGVAVSLPQQSGYLHYEGGIYARDGRCRAFDKRASGTLFGSGAGVVVLKRLKEALQDGDSVRAVILGSAVNNDGSRKVGYTAPGVDGQAEVIAEALEVADVEPASISYVETHGTGTPMGDPIEVEALNRAMRGEQLPRRSCAIGSVKTNFGHLEAAAGIAGLLKAALALERKQIPASLHFEEANPAIDFGSTPFYVNDRLRDWTSPVRPRRAGVSSFGIGGTNAHLVLEEAPEQKPSDEAAPPCSLLILSAKAPAALKTASDRLASHLEAHPDLPLPDVAATLQRGRKAFPHRQMLVADSCQTAAAALRNADRPPVRSAFCKAGYRPLAFLFPGQGAQHLDMGWQLYQHEPAFRRRLDRCAELLEPHLGLDLRRLIFSRLDPGSGSAEKLASTQFAQPALFAVEHSLAGLWMERGIQPEAMLGHSIGEWVAACLAGVFTLEEAVGLVATRGRLMQAQPRGAMLALALAAKEAEAWLQEGLSIAAVNGEQRCTVSGPSAEIGRLQQQLAAQGIQAQPLETSHAFHSAMMEPVRAPLLREMRRLRLNAPQIPFLSNLTGDWIQDSEATDPEYWTLQLRHPVRFGEGLKELLAKPGRLLLEVGPGQALSRLARRAAGTGGASRAVPSLCDPRRAGRECEQLLEALGQLWLAGVQVDWQGIHRRRRLPLPTYPFQRRRYWIEPDRRGAAQQRPPARRPNLSDWFSFPAWKHSAAPPNQPARMEGSQAFLLLGDEEGLAERLAEVLSKAGHDVAASFGADRRPLEEKGYERLLAGLDEEGKWPVEVIWMRALQRRLPSARSQPQGEEFFHDYLDLARALAQRQVGRPTRITVVANQVFDVLGEEELWPEKAMLWGAGQVIPLEYPHLSCRLIDIAVPQPRSPHEKRLLRLLLAELAGPAQERAVAYRRGRRWVQVFEPVKLPAKGPDDGADDRPRTWLITGGLGGIGLTLAERLAQSPGTRLALLGRAPLPPRQAWQDEQAAEGPWRSRLRTLLRLEERGAEVLTLAADVTRPDELGRALSQVRQRFGAIHGVIHAAGVAGGAVIERTTRESSQSILAAKVSGSRALAQAVANEPLEHFFLCSSLLAVSGAPGQAAYCAANAFLDAFAHQQASSGSLPMVSVNWGPWSGVGMASRAGRSQPAEGRDGLHPLLGELSEEDGRKTFTARLSPATHWLLSEHRLLGKAVLPGTGYLEMAVAAVREGGRDVELRDVLFLAPLMVEDGPGRQVRTQVEGDGGFRITSRADVDRNWQEHARGSAALLDGAEPPQHDIEEIRRRCPQRERLSADAGSTSAQSSSPLSWGPRWQALRQIHIGADEALAELELADKFRSDLDHWVLHPALLDAAAGFASRSVGQGLFLPLSYARLRVRKPIPARFYSWVRRRGGAGSNEETLSFDLNLLDEAGREIAAIEDFCLKRWQQGVRDGDTPSVLEQVQINPSEGAEAFVRLLAGSPASQVAVSPLDPAALLMQLEALQADPSSDGQPHPQHPRPEISTAYAPPRDEPESRLAEIWQQRLGVERVGIHDNFFELGGDSVLAIQVIAQANQTGLHLSPTQLFEHPTVAELAGRLGEGPPAAGRQGEEKDLSAAQEPGFSLAQLDEKEMAEVMAKFGAKRGTLSR